MVAPVSDLHEGSRLFGAVRCRAKGQPLRTLTFERLPGLRATSRGTFDDPDRVGIGSPIWTESAQTGVVLPADTDCFRKARATLDGVALEPTRYPTPTPTLARSAGRGESSDAW